MQKGKEMLLRDAEMFEVAKMLVRSRSKVLFANFNRVEMKHILREGNRCADRLANLVEQPECSFLYKVY